MTTTLFGASRSKLTPHYAILTPEGMVKAPLPGWQAAECVVVVAPAIGAGFTQISIMLSKTGRGELPADHREHFLLVLEGTVRCTINGQTHNLTKGGYAYAPTSTGLSIAAIGSPAHLLLFQRVYEVQAGVTPPSTLFGNENDVAGVPFMGDPDAMLKTLLPETMPFDMAVNIFTFEPGATLPIVETHVMEHGMLFLQGQGIYRLGDDWHPVQQGDALWIAPYCPQWFVATGKIPARYVYYKDVNRDPLSA